MLLGDLIAQLEDEALATEALLSLGDLALTTRIVSLAADQNISAGEFATRQSANSSAAPVTRIG